MPVYYFNVHCDDFEETDLVGEVCRNHEAARAEALRTARELIQQQLLNGAPLRGGWVEVEDEEHRPVLMLPLRAASS